MSAHGDALQRALRDYRIVCDQAGNVEEVELVRDLIGFYNVAPGGLPDHVDPHSGGDFSTAGIPADVHQHLVALVDERVELHRNFTPHGSHVHGAHGELVEP